MYLVHRWPVAAPAAAAKVPIFTNSRDNIEDIMRSRIFFTPHSILVELRA